MEKKKIDEKEKILTNKMKIIICKHCHKKIIHPELAGLTLICPHCKKTVNGQYSEIQGKKSI